MCLLCEPPHDEAAQGLSSSSYQHPTARPTSYPFLQDNKTRLKPHPLLNHEPSQTPSRIAPHLPTHRRSGIQSQLHVSMRIFIPTRSRGQLARRQEEACRQQKAKPAPGLPPENADIGKATTEYHSTLHFTHKLPLGLIAIGSSPACRHESSLAASMHLNASIRRRRGP